VIVGVNKYVLEENPEIDVLEVPSEVREDQVSRLRRLRGERDEAAVRSALEGVTQAAETGANLMAACLPAVRARASVGEISDAIEKVFGRFVATTQCISGVYAAEFADSDVITTLRKRTEGFEEKTGRRPRILLTKMGQDGHDRGIKVVATALADMGFDVDISPMFQTPEEAAKMAVENDVHMVGASSLAAGHKVLVPDLVDHLRKLGAGDVMVFAGGVIPPKDYAFLKERGVSGIFGPGTPIPESANKMLNILESRL
jgi:methylmalonyl-CoA mutase